MNRILTATTFLLILPGIANALLIDGTYSASTNFDSQGVPAISGSWSLDADVSGILGVGSEYVFGSPINVTSFSLTPSPLGSTVLSAGNVSAQLEYSDGVLRQVFLWGDAGGQFTQPGFDDFQLQYIDAFGTNDWLLLDARWSVATQSDMNYAEPFFPTISTTSGTVSIRSVPEPATLFLVGSVLLGLVWYRSRRSRISRPPEPVSTSGSGKHH